MRWSLTFLLLHNIFYHIGIYNSEYGYAGAGFKLYEIEDFIKRALYILIAMDKNEPLLGGFWFLKVLFISSILLNVLYFLQMKFKIGTLFSLLCIVGGLFICSFYDINIPHIGKLSTILIGTLFSIVGYLFRNKQQLQMYLTINGMLMTMFMILLFVSWKCHQLSMFCVGNDVLLYLPISLVGVFFIMGVSRKLMKATYINNVLCYVGKHTMIIFALHFLAFKVVSAIIIVVLGFEYVRLSEFPVITNVSSFWWLAYSLVGVLLPLFTIEKYQKCLTLIRQ